MYFVIFFYNMAVIITKAIRSRHQTFNVNTGRTKLLVSRSHFSEEDELLLLKQEILRMYYKHPAVWLSISI